MGLLFYPYTVRDEMYRTDPSSGQNRTDWERCRSGADNPRASPHRDAALGLPFSFRTAVDMAPMALRREAFERVGMFDEGFALEGECGILADWELSVRLWMDGWQVAVMQNAHAVFKHVRCLGCLRLLPWREQGPSLRSLVCLQSCWR